jgi:hypothetical protein
MNWLTLGSGDYAQCLGEDRKNGGGYQFIRYAPISHALRQDECASWKQKFLGLCQLLRGLTMLKIFGRMKVKREPGVTEIFDPKTGVRIAVMRLLKTPEEKKRERSRKFPKGSFSESFVNRRGFGPHGHKIFR